MHLGKYPIIEYSNVAKEDETGYREVVAEATGKTKTGYSMPYTVENIDQLHKDSSDDYEFEELTDKQIKPTRYYLLDLRRNVTLSVKKWEDFRDGDFDELWEYGKKITSEQEAQAIKAGIELQRK